MDLTAFERNGQLLDKYRELLSSVPGFMYLEHNTEGIVVHVRKGNLTKAKEKLPKKLDGVPLKVEPRVGLPSY